MTGTPLDAASPASTDRLGVDGTTIVKSSIQTASRGGIEPPTRRLRERLANIHECPLRILPFILPMNACWFVRRFPLVAIG
jgi:hypothetical protein